MSKAKKAISEDLTMDMTPMIDCVFLLMIFFVLVIDLSQQELEDLILPKAEYAQPDEEPPDNRPVLNVTQDGTMIYKRTTYYDPKTDGDNFSRIHDLLLRWKREVATKDKITTEKVGGGMTMTVINDPVLVRADKWTEWHYVAKFMEQCTDKQAAFWMLELAMSEQDKEEKYLKAQALKGN